MGTQALVGPRRSFCKIISFLCVTVWSGSGECREIAGLLHSTCCLCLLIFCFGRPSLSVCDFGFRGNSKAASLALLQKARCEQKPCAKPDSPDARIAGVTWDFSPVSKRHSTAMETCCWSPSEKTSYLRAAQRKDLTACGQSWIHPILRNGAITHDERLDQKQCDRNTDDPHIQRLRCFGGQRHICRSVAPSIGLPNSIYELIPDQRPDALALGN